MEPRLPHGLDRSVEKVLAAYAIARASYDYEPDTSRAKSWLAGMVNAGQWVVGYTDRSPVSDEIRPATVDTIGEELLAAGMADMPGSAPGGPEQMYARGAYRMLAYVLSYTDDLPVKLSTAVATAVANERRAA